MISSIQFAGLVGKYIRMERPADEVEALELRATTGETVDNVGCEGVVALVYDSDNRVGGRAVEIVMEYGMGFAVFESELDQWKFHIWPSEDVAKELRMFRER